MGNPFGENPDTQPIHQDDENQPVLQDVDIVALLARNALVPDIGQWIKIAKEDPSSEEFPEIRVWTFGLGVDPNNLHSSEVFREIAHIATFPPGPEESRDEPDKDPVITLMRLLEGAKFPMEVSLEDGNTSTEEGVPFPKGSADEFIKSERYRQIRQSRNRVKKPDGVITPEEYLDFLRTIPLRAELTVIDGYEMLVHLQVFAQKTHSEKMRKIPDEDLLVMRMYFGPDIDIFQGIVSWMQKNGVNIELPAE